MRAPDAEREAAGSIEVITPSYRPDLDLCQDLNDSVIRFAPSNTAHRIIVPDRDIDAFAHLARGRTRVEAVSQLLPASFHRLPRVNAWVNTRRPWPPVRGWISQQIIKLAAATQSAAPVALLVDSDMVFVRAISSAAFLDSGTVSLFRRQGGVHEGMPDHVAWHRVARRLLGLPSDVKPPLPDYIGWPVAWDPRLVSTMLARVEQVTRVPWQTAIGRELHFSEDILYGVYVELVTGAKSVVSDMHCVVHSDETPLTAADLTALLQRTSANDFAIMISAKSGTPIDIRRAGIEAWATR